MLSIENKARIAAIYEVFQSVNAVLGWQRHENGRNASLNSRTIHNLHQHLFESGSVLNKNRPGRARVSITEENIERVHEVLKILAFMLICE